MRKILLLGATALMALAFVVPASASAYTWTWRGYGLEEIQELYEGQTVNELYEGPIGFSLGWPSGSYSCDAKVEVEAEGPSAGRISKLTRDPSSCWGTGSFAGCVPKELSSNIADGWGLDVGVSPPQVTNSSKTYLEITDVYQGCGREQWKMKFLALSLVPTQDEQGMITKFTLEGWETNGLIHDVFGPFVPSEPLPYPEYEQGLQ